MTLHDRPIKRRVVVAGAGVAAAVAAVGCSTDTPDTKRQSSAAPSPLAKKAAILGDGVPTPAGEEIAQCRDIPVGSGILCGNTVVTQPAENEYYAFSNECPHAGCAVTQVVRDKIHCTCHGSEFGLRGEVERGPARKPLRPCQIVMANEKIFKQD